MLKDFVRKHFHTVLYKKANTRAIFTVFGIAIKEFRVSFSQFFTWKYPLGSFFRAIKYALLGLSRIVMGKSVRISYAFTGEDRIIESLLKTVITYNGFYVDAGCNYPRFISNTFLLYRKGWRGICIDANQSLIKKYRKIRPRDKAVHAVVSETKTAIEFFELTNNGLSSADKTYVKEMVDQGQKIVDIQKLTSKTLTEILDENNAPSSFDLLSVDIEELDLQALRSLDFQKYQPRLIVTEAEDFDPSQPATHPIFSFLKEKGYTLKGSILTNLYFMKE